LIKVKESYEIVTQESAREGDFAETGWINEEGVDFDDIEEVIEHLRMEGIIEASSSCFHTGVWYNTEAQQDMHDGSWESRNFFIEGATEDEQEAIYNALFPNNRRCGL